MGKALGCVDSILGSDKLGSPGQACSPLWSASASAHGGTGPGQAPSEEVLCLSWGSL